LLAINYAFCGQHHERGHALQLGRARVLVNVKQPDAPLPIHSFHRIQKLPTVLTVVAVKKDKRHTAPLHTTSDFGDAHLNAADKKWM
jgi:hypothetical protein